MKINKSIYFLLSVALLLALTISVMSFYKYKEYSKLSNDIELKDTHLVIEKSKNIIKIKKIAIESLSYTKHSLEQQRDESLKYAYSLLSISTLIACVIFMLFKNKISNKSFQSDP